MQVLGKMNPEAGAKQLEQMDVETAGALLLKLEPKVAAPLLDEMPPAKSAQLAAILAAAAGVSQSADGYACPSSSDHSAGTSCLFHGAGDFASATSNITAVGTSNAEPGNRYTAPAGR